MDEKYKLPELYAAQQRTNNKGEMSSILYEDEWIKGLITYVDCRKNQFEVEIPGEYSSGLLDIGKVQEVREEHRRKLKSYKDVKIWVDDIRPVPAGFEGTKSVNETIYERNFLSGSNTYCKSGRKSEHGANDCKVLADLKFR